MASLNTAQIISLGQQFGQNISNDQAGQIMNSTGGGDPTQVQNYFQGASAGTAMSQGVMSMAGSLQQMQLQANQPGINTMQTVAGSLQTQYGSLLQSITQQGSAQIAQGTSAIGLVEAQRGILPSSGAYQSAMEQGMAPVYANVAANEGSAAVNETNAMTPLEQAIATLQTGNVQGAIQGATTVSGQQAGIQEAAIGSAATVNAANISAQAGIQEAQYGAGGSLVNLGNGLVYNTSTKSFVGASGLSGVTMQNGTPMINV